MFTQAMPAYANALRSGDMTQAMQALGNCAQPLTHRGGVNFASDLGPNRNGVYTTQPWNPADYTRPSNQRGVDVAGMTTIWNSGNRYDSRFFFPTAQYFTQNQFFGGPQVFVLGGVEAGEVAAQNIVGVNVNVQQLAAEEINGQPVIGPAGPPGADGREGRDGVPGQRGRPGRDGVNPAGEFKKLFYHHGIGPRVVFQPEQVAQHPFRYVKDAWLSPFVQVDVPTNAISGGSVSLAAASVVIPTAATCDLVTGVVYWSATTEVYALTSTAATFTGFAASTVSVLAATTGGTIEASQDLLDTGGILIKGADADFWGDTVPVTVARDPELRGVLVQERRFFVGPPDPDQPNR